MSGICPNCKIDYPSNYDYCHNCDTALSEYAKSRERIQKCSNPECKSDNPIHANYCRVCGWALSEYAKDNLKIERNKKIRDLKGENSKLKEDLKEIQSQNESLIKENLINETLIKENNEREQNVPKEKELVIVTPTSVYIIFSIIGFILLILLWCFIK